MARHSGSVDLPLPGLHVQRQREARVVRKQRCRLQDGRRGAEGRRHHRAPGARPAAVLPLGRVPRAPQRRAARPGRPGRNGHAFTGAAPPEPVLDGAASDLARVQRGGHVRQARRDAQPAASHRGEDRSDPRELPAGLESLLAVDDAVAQIVNGSPRSASSTTRTSSSPRTTGSSTASIVCRRARCSSTSRRSASR